MCSRHTEYACSILAFSAKSAVSANSANSFWQTWALSFFSSFCDTAMSAKSFWPTRPLLKTTGFGEAAEITEITVSTFGLGGDLGGLRASKSWRD
jgi:hypothetical protein